jgi:hypothetical protein
MGGLQRMHTCLDQDQDHTALWLRLWCVSFLTHKSWGPEILGLSNPEILGLSNPEILGLSNPEILGLSNPEILGPGTRHVPPCGPRDCHSL